MSEETFYVSKPWKFSCGTCQKETVKKGRIFLTMPFCKSCVSATARIASQKGRAKPRAKEEYLCERRLQHQERKEFFELYGFELLSPSSEYQGVFSPLRVICAGGHETTVKFNNFLSEAPKGKGNCMQCLKEKKRKPWVEIVAKFQKKNCKILLEQKDYTGNKQDVPFKCHCGREDTVRLGNMREKWIGCPKCSKKRERVPWSVVKETIEADGCILETKEENYRSITQKLWVSCSCCENKDYNMHFPVTLKEFRRGKRCPDCLKDRKEATCLRIYGVTNPAKNRQVMEKAEETRLEKFGVRHVMQRSDFVARAQATNLERYGLKYAFMSQETHEKIVETMFKRYGRGCFLGTEEFKVELVKRYGEDCFTRTKEYKVIMMEKFGQEYYAQSEVWKKKVLENFGSEQVFGTEKFKAIMMERYGVESSLQSPIIMARWKESVMKHFGVEHPMQHPDVFEKWVASCYKTKTFVSQSGKEFLCQGFEPFCLHDLLEREGYSEDDIATRGIPPVPYFFEKRRVYFPDIYIEKEKRLIEVKSEWTLEKDLEKNYAKIKACKKLGFDVELRVYDRHGDIIRIIKPE
ncbi:zinc-ribbon-containing protein [Brazilian marseillevirus]|uniref:zinc-ribbon-containing protein n=1 Tax=Brazilian marseillevirus TaxID=1813599 RepID=UPI0007824FE7|nr:zinc-ribbon-containing protein [Brazilian marseillevirus]AMQ10907.1 zinc-ribbon-containing protein [Brazilian marseillevirus]